MHLPAGFAHYDATSLGGGVHAEAALDLTGTPFRFPQIPAADPAFCLSPPGDETIVPLFIDAEAASECDGNTCWSGTCTTGPLTDAGSDDPRADMAAVSPPDAAGTPDVSVITPADAAATVPDAAATPDASGPSSTPRPRVSASAS